MTKDELVAKLRDIEWEDFEVKAAKSELPKNVWEKLFFAFMSVLS